MEGETKAIRANAFKLAWFMRGGITYTDVLNLSIAERELITNLVEENLDTTKKTNLPFF